VTVKTEKNCTDGGSSNPCNLEEGCEDEDDDDVEHGASIVVILCDLPYYGFSVMAISCEESKRWDDYHRREFKKGQLMRSSRRGKKGSLLRQELDVQARVVWSKHGDGLPDDVIDRYPECPFSGEYVSASMCPHKCPNHYFADLAWDLSAGFSFSGGDPPTVEEMHAMLMAECALGWYARNLDQVKQHITVVLDGAGATTKPNAEGVQPTTMEQQIETLAHAYYHRERRTRSESMHWLFLKRMRSLVARKLVAQSIGGGYRARVSCTPPQPQGPPRPGLVRRVLSPSVQLKKIKKAGV
jgi:hypothetical protein